MGIGLGLAGWLAFLVLSRSPALAEVVAGSGPIPVFVVLVVVRQVAGAVAGLRGFQAGAGFGRTALAGGLRLAQDAGILLFLFYLLWGFQYARPGIEERLGIDASGEVDADELRHLAARAVEVSNLLYRQVHGSSDAGAPTAAPPIPETSEALEAAWERVRAELDLGPLLSEPHGRPKPFLASPLVKPFGVAGMHFPFTGEALVLRDLPAVILGLDLGHEMAHQRGFAREDEANVMGFLVARASDDLVARYGAYVFLQRQLLAALQRVAPNDARELAAARDPGVARDLDDLRAYWEPTQGIARAAASRANDAMLRSHGVPEGVASYQGSVWVLVALARERGEGVLFPPSSLTAVGGALPSPPRRASD
jgi:hypothetical protein